MNFLNNRVILYKSKLQPSVTLSSAEAEYMGLADEAEEVIYLRRLLEEIGFPQVGATLIWEDNKAAILLLLGDLLLKVRRAQPAEWSMLTSSFDFAEKIKEGVLRILYRPRDLTYTDLMTRDEIVDTAEAQEHVRAMPQALSTRASRG
jgi:hypothetical protein